MTTRVYIHSWFVDSLMLILLILYLLLLTKCGCNKYYRPVCYVIIPAFPCWHNLVTCYWHCIGFGKFLVVLRERLAPPVAMLLNIGVKVSKFSLVWIEPFIAMQFQAFLTTKWQYWTKRRKEVWLYLERPLAWLAQGKITILTFLCPMIWCHSIIATM